MNRNRPAAESDPLKQRTARLFRNGSNQAVRLPRDLEIDADEVLIPDPSGGRQHRPDAQAALLG
jgi:hypothetical protein